MATTITTWTSLIEYFFPVFTQPTAIIFMQLMTGWVLCTTRRTVTGMLPFADPEGTHAHDAFHRFFPDSRWACRLLWRLLTRLLVKVFYPTGIIQTDLDDTLFHRSGPQVNGAGWWRDAVRSTQKKIVYAWGLNLAVLTLRVQPPWGGEPLGLPINMRLHRKKGISLMALAEDMIQEVRQWLPERTFRIAGDGFYASLAGSRGTRHHLISRMRRDAALYDLPSPKPKGRRGPQPKKGPRLATPAALARRVQNWKKVVIPMRGRKVKRLVYARKVIWYKVSHTPVLLVISRDPQGKEPDDFLVTTDTAMKASEVVACFSGRWSIEDTFKWCKQMLGSQHPQTWKRHGPERAAMLGLWLYSVVWFWYLQQGKRKRTISWKPWYPHKAYPSFRDAIACLRKDLWRVRIKHIFGNSLEHDNVFEFLIESLAKAG